MNHPQVNMENDKQLLFRQCLFGTYTEMENVVIFYDNSVLHLHQKS